MKPQKIASFATVALLSISTIASADPYGQYDVRYDRVVAHANDLEYIAAELRDCFRDQFRSSRVHGKLVSRSNKLKNRARNLGRRAASHGSCNWHNEIHRIDDLVCELDRLVDEAILRSRRGYDRPLCGNAVRTVKRLINKAHAHAAGLKDALFQVNQPIHADPRFDGPIINQPAPRFAPSQGLGINNFQNFQGSNPFLANQQRTRQRIYSSRPSCDVRGRSGIELNRNGVAFNVGGLRFYVDR